MSCAGKKTPLPLQVPDLTESPSLSADKFAQYRTAVGIPLYVQAEIPHCQFAIKTPSQRLGNPTEACWSMLKHLGLCPCSVLNGVLVCVPRS